MILISKKSNSELKSSKGAFFNYADQILSFFWPPTTIMVEEFIIKNSGVKAVGLKNVDPKSCNLSSYTIWRHIWMTPWQACRWCLRHHFVSRSCHNLHHHRLKYSMQKITSIICYKKRKKSFFKKFLLNELWGYSEKFGEKNKLHA